MNIKFSLLLPTRNSIQYLKYQIDSILSQNYDNYEVVVVDGFSNDGTWEYLQIISSENPQFKIFQSHPKGVYSGINECARRANGEYLMFTMSDDTLLNGALSEISSFASKFNSPSLIHWKIRTIDDLGASYKKTWESFGSVDYWGDIINKDHIRIGDNEHFRHFFLGSVYISLTELAVKRDIFEPFNEKCGAWADLLWAANIVRHKEIYHISNILATWRIRDGQTTDFTNPGASIKNHISLINEMTKINVYNLKQISAIKLYTILLKSLAKYEENIFSYGKILGRIKNPHIVVLEFLNLTMSKQKGLKHIKNRIAQAACPNTKGIHII